MKVKQIRIWLSLNLDRNEHCTVIEKTYTEPIDKESINDALIIDIIRQNKNLDVAPNLSGIRNSIWHEINHADHPGEKLLEDRYFADLDPNKMSSDEISRFLLAINDIQTEKLDEEEADWDEEDENEEPLSPANLAGYGFPAEMLSYLAKPENLYKKITGADDAPDELKLRAANKLKLINIEFEATDEHIRISDKNLLADPNYDPDSDSEKSYKATAIDLIGGNNSYSNEGLLIWIVELKVFGAFDEDHQNLVVYPDATPEDIQEKLGIYLQAQWSYGKNYIVESGNIYDYYQPWKHFSYAE